MPELNIIIPVYNEASSLNVLYEKVRSSTEGVKVNFNIIFINDGSRDNSALELEKISKNNKNVVVIELSRNFGKEAAITAGLDASQADAVIIMDADLQHPPELIPTFINQWQAGSVVVVGKRINRDSDPYWKNIGAHIFYKLIHNSSDYTISKDIGDFRLMDKSVVDAITKLRENHRFMKGLYAWVGFDKTIVEYHCANRDTGTSKWGIGSLANLALEGITSFSIKPLRIASIIGGLTAVISIIYACWIILKTILYGDPVQGYPSLMVVMLFLGGTQLLALGIIGEYVGRTFGESKRRPVYIIKKVLNSENIPDISNISNNET